MLGVRSGMAIPRDATVSAVVGVGEAEAETGPQFYKRPVLCWW